MQSNDRESIVARLGRDGFNELDLTCKTGPAEPSKKPQFTDAWLTIVLFSAVNILWAPVPEEKLKNASEERKRFNFAMRSRGPVQPTGCITPAASAKMMERNKPDPTEIDIMLGVEIPEKMMDEMDLQKTCVTLIRSAVPLELKDCDVFGYGCVEGKCRNMSMIHSVGSRGANIDELGEKFENIYPILIGPKASCEGLAASLGSVETWPLFSREVSPTWIMSIPSEFVVAPFPRKADALAPSAADPGVRRWIV